jgi:endonuclease YncB( thermonuclease family)
MRQNQWTGAGLPGQYGCMRFSLIFALVLLASPAAAQSWTSPARIIDGDTLEFDQTRVGLFGIDSPERGQVCTRGAQRYDCATESRAQLANLIAGRGVRCDQTAWDHKWSRPLARCWVGTLDLNAEMVRTGYAVAFHTAEYAAQENEARAARRGLWAGEFERPHSYRKRIRTG